MSQRTGRVNSSELLHPSLHRLLGAPERRSPAGRRNVQILYVQIQMQTNAWINYRTDARVKPVPTRTISILQRSLLQRCMATRFTNITHPSERPLQFRVTRKVYPRWNSPHLSRFLISALCRCSHPQKRLRARRSESTSPD